MMSETSNTPLPPNKTSGRKILLILALIFVLPFTVAATLHLLNLKPSGHSYGNLIQPPKALAIPVLHDVQGKAFAASQWLKIWSVVMVDSTGCAAPCEAQVHLLKQVHTSLNKDKHRLQRVLLVPTALKTEALTALQKQYPDLLILGGADAETAKFIESFSVSNAGVYLVDPLGNLMMSYPEKIEAKGIFSDLKRLLKNSWAG
jgi:cytochrome oxidase Cu insertion factor (SCO1/SenC/PrrC family)